VWLGARATETNLKALSRTGKLARYRVLHFATHGVFAGESEAILQAKAEPALILTPPGAGLGAGRGVAGGEHDPVGIQLQLCHLRATRRPCRGWRARSSMPRRTLLVSHWYVNSEAAVKLTTGAFDALSAAPKIGRAEALRRSMARLITGGRPNEAHPEYWAPFVLVGEDR
jgi:CHAT domain-containing protein